MLPTIRGLASAVTTLDDIPFAIDPQAVFAQLRLDPGGQYAAEVRALIDGARALARPRALYTTAGVRRRGADAVVIADAAGQARFVSRALRVNLEGVERVFPYVATCGTELDALPLPPGDVLAQFCRDTVKEMALWAALSHLYAHLADGHGTGPLASMNPGSGEADVWPIEQQRDLFALLGDGPAAIGVTLTASCLMIPNKSVSGIFYPSAEGFESCQLCRQERCTHRRAPFDPARWARTFGETS